MSVHGSICAQLPVEILENIFCQVPFQDLMRNCTLVCKRWNDVIQKPEFLIWKKTYNRLIMGCEETLKKMEEVMDNEGMRESPESFAPKLCEFVKNFRTKNPELLKSLKRHSKYHLITSFLHSTSKSIRKSPWSVIMLLTVVSTTVEDITEIIWTMMAKTSNCLVMEVIELLYLLASMYWMLKSEARINSGLHYRIIYACHLFESTSVISQESSYNGTSSDLPLTHEQLAIIKHPLWPGEVIKIVAFAGTGKTSTLVEFAKERPHTRFLYVSFNRSIKEHAERIFPGNVEPRTTHSLAYGAVGRRYRSKFGSAVRSTDVQRILSGDTTFIHAERVAQTVKNFMASNRHRITTEDVTKSRFTSNDKEKEKYYNSDGYKWKVVEDAEIVWKKMIDLYDKAIYMTHDGYLKLYQMSAPTLDQYDCILVDEAQDLTPAVADILLSQRCSKILVGDPYQQIYSFRGAENVLESVESTHTYYLTQSFRFGEEIGYVANSLLEVQKDHHGKTLIGSKKSGGVMGDTVGQVAIICRSNFGVFSEESRLCHDGNNLKVAFAGGLQGYNLDRVNDIYSLSTGFGQGYIKDPLIRRFRNYNELCKFATECNDKELGAKIKIIEHFGANVPIYINAIKKNAIEDASKADFIVSTAHKAKGLQFSSVRVHDDFTLVDDSMLSTKVTEADIRDENNLLYVAVTRAQNRLILNQTILRALQMNKEYLLQPTTGESYDGNGSKSCTFCYDPLIFDPVPSLLIEQPHHIIYNGSNFRETKSQGLVCRICALEKAPHLDCFFNPPEEKEKKKKKKKEKKKTKKNRRSSV